MIDNVYGHLLKLKIILIITKKKTNVFGKCCTIFSLLTECSVEKLKKKKFPSTNGQ